MAGAFDIATLVVVAVDLSEVLSVEGDGEVVEELGDVSGGLVAEFVGHEEVPVRSWVFARLNKSSTISNSL